jgi:hypothetical protein
MDNDQSPQEVALVKKYTELAENTKTRLLSIVNKHVNLTPDAPSVAPSLPVKKPTDVAKRGPILFHNAPRRCRTGLPKREAHAGVR